VYKELGTYGAWLNPALGNAPRLEYAPELEELGYDTIWVGIGPDPVGDMNLLEQMIEATRTAIIASAIINMWQDDAHSIAHHYHRIVDHHGPHLLLGIGLGHPESRDSYQKPYARMVPAPRRSGRRSCLRQPIPPRGATCARCPPRNAASDQPSVHRPFRPAIGPQDSKTVGTDQLDSFTGNTPVGSACRPRPPDRSQWCRTARTGAARSPGGGIDVQHTLGEQPSSSVTYH
jgi:hypothetical protein